MATTTTALPDLTMAYSADNLSVVQGNDFSFNIIAKNIAPVPVTLSPGRGTAFSDFIYLDSSFNALAPVYPDVPMLANSIISTIGYSIKTATLSVGTHTITLEADGGPNYIQESNESNNSISFNFTVLAPTTATPTPVTAPPVTAPVTPPVVEPVVTITYNPNGIPGQAYRIYNAAFSRLPDASGLAYWTNILNSGKSLVEIATGFMQSPEFKTMYGANPTHDTFVTKAYNNVLHRPQRQRVKVFGSMI